MRQKYRKSRGRIEVKREVMSSEFAGQTAGFVCDDRS